MVPEKDILFQRGNLMSETASSTVQQKGLSVAVSETGKAKGITLEKAYRRRLMLVYMGWQSVSPDKVKGPILR